MTKRRPKDLISQAKAATAELSAARASSEAKAWKRRYEESLASAVSLEQQVDALLGMQGPPAIQRLERLRKSKPKGVAAIAPATDWHVEEVVSKAGTNGKNHFDIREAEVRIKRFYAKVLELIEWQSRLARVVELWHPLLGDLLSGYIHEELMETNSLSPTEACVFLMDMICSGIDLWLRETRLPILIPTCVGNHGRTTPKKRIKTSHRNSFEWLLYRMLARYYDGHRRVAWQVGEGYHNTQTVMGRRVRFHHGDGLRYMGGVGGITIPVNKAVAQWDKVESVDLDVFGHWHTFLWNYTKWVSCGSLMGYSEYSVEIKADFQHPSQAFIVLDRAYGVTSALPIFLTPPASSK